MDLKRREAFASGAAGSLMTECRGHRDIFATVRRFPEPVAEITAARTIAVQSPCRVEFLRAGVFAVRSQRLPLLQSAE